jgi:sulfotransferase family protein
VVLTYRPEEAWWKSFSAIIAKLAAERARFPLPPHVAAMLESVGVEMIKNQTFGGTITDVAGALAAFRRRTEEVRAAIPPARLVAFDVAEGWGPLCRFLGGPMPEGPFARVSSAEEFWPMVRGGGGGLPRVPGRLQGPADDPAPGGAVAAHADRQGPEVPAGRAARQAQGWPAPPTRVRPRRRRRRGRRSPWRGFRSTALAGPAPVRCSVEHRHPLG